MEASLTGTNLALHYSAKQIIDLKKRLQTENFKVVKQRMRNQEHIVHIQKLKSIILSKDKQIQSLYEQLAKVQDDQTTFQIKINELTKTNYETIIMNLSKIQQLQGFFKGRSKESTVQSYLQTINMSINMIISKINDNIDETSILCDQIKTLENTNETLKNQISALQKVQKEKNKQNILQVYEHLSKNRPTRSKQYTQQLYQIAEAIRTAAERLLDEI